MCYDQDARSGMNLDNVNSAHQCTILPRDFVAKNGCRVILQFTEKPNPNVDREIAEMLISIFLKKRSNDDEESHVSLQSLDEGAG